MLSDIFIYSIPCVQILESCDEWHAHNTVKKIGQMSGSAIVIHLLPGIIAPHPP